MNRIIYSFGISILSIFFSIFYWVKPKWKLRFKGLQKQEILSSVTPRLWFHCASAGEYEQIAAVIEQLSKAFPEHEVIISFFSPSGIEWMESKDIKWKYVYLPFDTSKKMKKIIDKINPKFLIIAKNELWFNLLNELYKKDIPIYLVSANITKRFVGFRSTFFKKHLSYIKTIFAQDQKTVNLLLGRCNEVLLSGDTRISRIHNKTKKSTTKDIRLFKTNNPSIIYGSLHKEDAELLTLIEKFPEFNHIIVPHDISKKSIDFYLQFLGPNPPLFSKQNFTADNYIIIDKMGLLAELYKQSTYAYIGGGFSEGIHNIIEPLIHHNTIFIGPNYKSFNEATTLVNENVVHVIKSPLDLEVSLRSVLKKSEKEMEKNKEIAAAFINTHKGSAKFVTDKIYNQLR